MLCVSDVGIVGHVQRGVGVFACVRSVECSLHLHGSWSDIGRHMRGEELEADLIVVEVEKNVLIGGVHFVKNL